MTIQPLGNSAANYLKANNAQADGVSGSLFAELLAHQQDKGNSSTSTVSYSGPAATRQSSAAPSSSSDDTAVQDFMNYMNETPEQRFIDSWLHAHHLSKEALAKMSPQDRDAIMKQIEEDMKLHIKQAVQQKTGTVISA